MSLRAAINAMCRACIYDPHSGLGPWRMQVEACTSPSCPLYAVRPRSTARDRGELGVGGENGVAGENGAFLPPPGTNEEDERCGPCSC